MAIRPFSSCALNAAASAARPSSGLLNAFGWTGRRALHRPGGRVLREGRCHGEEQDRNGVPGRSLDHGIHRRPLPPPPPPPPREAAARSPPPPRLAVADCRLEAPRCEATRVLAPWPMPWNAAEPPCRCGDALGRALACCCPRAPPADRLPDTWFAPPR